MRMSVTIILIFIIFLSFGIRVFIRYKISGIKGAKEYFKAILLGVLCSVFILTLYNFLPKHDVEVDIIIKNNGSSAEIHINDNFYIINESKIVYNINNSGFIAIKTESSNIIVFYSSDKSIFPFNRKININLKDGKININSHFVKITKWIENKEYYDSFLEIRLRNK